MRKRLPIFYSALLLTGVNLILRLVSTSFQVFVSGRIGAAGVGLLQLVLSVGMLANTAATAGIRTTAMYLTAEELGKNKPQNVGHVLTGCFRYSIICSIAVSAFLYAVAPIIAEKWIAHPEVTSAIRVLAAFLPVNCLCGVMTGYFTAANRIGTLAAVEVAEQFCSMVITITLLLLWVGTDPAKACQAVIGGSGITACITLMTLAILRHKERPTSGDPIPVASRLLQAAVPLAVADDMKVGINTLENLMVPKRLSLFHGSADPLADFGRVCGMVFPILMFPAAILFGLCELLIPELARCNASGSKVRIQYLAGRSLHIACVYGCGCGGILFLAAKALCSSLYTDPEAGKMLQLFALLAPMLYCDNVTDAMTKGLGQQRTAVRYNILTAAMDVALLYFLLPKMGMPGYFISFLVTHVINFFLSIKLLLRTTGPILPLKKPLLSLFSMGVGIATALLAPENIQWIVFLPVFCALLVLLRVISIEDLRWLQTLTGIKKCRS